MKIKGGISWYGGANDAGDNNRPASGVPNEKLPAIAVYNPHTLHGYWLVHDPHTGHREVVFQGDIGPAPDTGRKVDFNPLAAKLFGWEASDAKFPTDHKVEAEYLGKSKVRARAVRRQIQGRTAAPAQEPAQRVAANTALGRPPAGAPTLGGLTLPQIQRALALMRAGL